MKNKRYFNLNIQHSLLFVLLMTIQITPVFSATQKADKPKFSVFLFDETDSFGTNTSRGIATSLYWQDALKMGKTIINKLSPGDRFIVLSIDEVSMQEEDVLMRLLELNQSSLRARLEKRKISREIMELKRRKEIYRSTDIIGALYHAAYFASKAEGFDIHVFVFSDMKQEPTPPRLEDAADLVFPSGTKGYFFFVDVAGREQWSALLSLWRPIIEHAQLETDSNLNFFQAGEAQAELQRILKSW